MSRLILSSAEAERLYEQLEEIKKLVKTQKNEVADPIYSTEEIMGLLKVSRRTLQNWRDNGVIEFSAVCGKFFYRLSAVNKMLEENLKKTEEI